MYQAVEITGCFLRVVFVLAPNPTRNWTQKNKFKSTLKHTQVFFKSVFKNYFLMKSLKPFK